MIIHNKKVIWVYTLVSSVVFALIVLVLGLITPGYDHFRHTISRLAIEEYGFIQTLNFLQFSGCVYFSGLLISQSMIEKQSQKLWSTVFSVSALMWILVGLFPTDQIEDARINLDSLSLNGGIHLGIVFLVFVLFPLGVHKLSLTLKKEPPFQHLSWFTMVCGYTATILCYVWTYLFFQGLLYDYLGLLQKIIASVCLIWMMTMLWSVRPGDQKRLHRTAVDTPA